MITNLINNKIYIGKAYNINKRLAQHWRQAKYFLAQNKKRTPIQSAMLKYGIKNFKIEKILDCSSEIEAYDKEIELIKEYKNKNYILYNATEGGKGTGALNSGENNGMYNKAYSVEQRKKLSEAIKKSKEGNRNLSHKHSEETIKKLKERNKLANKLSNEQKDQAVLDYASGLYTKNNLCEKYGCDLNSMKYILRKWPLYKKIKEENSKKDKTQKERNRKLQATEILDNYFINKEKFIFNNILTNEIKKIILDLISLNIVTRKDISEYLNIPFKSIKYICIKYFIKNNKAQRKSELPKTL